LILRIVLVLVLTTHVVPAFSAESSTSHSQGLSELIRSALEERISGADIRIPSLDRLCDQSPISDYATITKVRLVEDRPNGIALFEISGSGTEGQSRTDLVQTPYSAWKKVLVPIRRINPNSKLKSEDFRTIEINVATGSAREYRGVLASPDLQIDGLQSRQTLLENQFVTTSAIERQPDLKRGDLVRLDLVSGELTLSTQATASETGSVGDRIRVMTTKSKKEVVGTIREDHAVEVRL